MRNPLPWVDRRWVFDQPAELVPCTAERLRGTPARLQAMLSRCTELRLVTRPQGDAWSIQEHVGHLLDLEALPDGRLDDFLEARTTLRPADMSNAATWDADHNDAPIADLLRRFGETRDRLLERVDALNPSQWSITSRHPRLDTPMRVCDMLFFQADHDDHHLASITSLLRGD